MCSRPLQNEKRLLSREGILFRVCIEPLCADRRKFSRHPTGGSTLTKKSSERENNFGSKPSTTDRGKAKTATVRRLIRMSAWE